MALHLPSNCAAAHTLLGYERRDAGVCPVVLHPVHGEPAKLSANPAADRYGVWRVLDSNWVPHRAWDMLVPGRCKFTPTQQPTLGPVVSCCAGSSAYPVTLFTDASPALLAQALAAISDGPSSPAPGSSGAGATAATAGGGAVPAPLLLLDEVHVPTLTGGVAVAGLSLVLQPGEHLLIVGEAGGKQAEARVC